MKRNIVLPLAALLMIPAISGCNTNPKNEVLFNNDQSICTYGTQYIFLTVRSSFKSKAKIKESLSANDFEMPEKYASKKKISLASRYSEYSFILGFEDQGGGIKDLEEESTSFEIKVKNSAFTTETLGGKITVSLFRNQIRYDGDSSETVGPVSYYGYNKVNMIGASFVDTIKNRLIDLDANGIPTKPGGGEDPAKDLLKVNGIKAGGKFGYFELEAGNYMFLEATFTDVADVSILFKNRSTDLTGYVCTYKPIGLGGGDNNYFTPEN